MAYTPQLFDNDRLHFPILQAVSANPSSFRSLKPSDVDALGVEISKALERCSVPESSVSIEEPEVNELMLGCIGTVDFHLQENSARSSEAGAMLLLFR